ncbi:MAG: insulinase family protein, partial [Candidatus Eisenbacteria bacterium]|nr:insulinase family protein [Candidatus Eisenbacteria bacterium]
MKFLRQIGPIEEPRVLRRELRNGLVILAEPAEHIPSLAIGVWVRSGSRHEPEGQIGIAHLLEHMVFKGTRQHSAYQIAKRIEALGGQVDAFTTKETTCYHARVFAGHRAETVHLLGEILSQSAFPRVELDKERQVVIEEIHSYDDNPEEYVFDLATEEVWRGHPLGNSILGRAETLHGMGTRDLKRFHQGHYTRPNLLVTVAGKFDFDRLCAEV